MRKCTAKVSHEKKESTKFFRRMFYRSEYLFVSRCGNILSPMPNYAPLKNSIKRLCDVISDLNWMRQLYSLIARQQILWLTFYNPGIVETRIWNLVPTTNSSVAIRISIYNLAFRITKFGLSFLNFTSNCRITYSFYNRIVILNFGYAAESVNCQTE